MRDLPTPKWSALPPARLSAPPPRRILPIVVPLVLIAGLWLLGAHELAVIALVLVTIVTAATLVSPRFRELLDRGAAWLGHHVGRLLTIVLLGLVQLVIFTPVSLFARATRTDPMDPFAGRRVDSRWLPRPADESDLRSRQFGDERYRREATGSSTPVGSPRWIRGVVGAVVLLLVADVALGSLIVWIDRGDPYDPVAGPVFGFDPVAQEALVAQDNAAQLFREFGSAGLGATDPFIGWRFGTGVTHESDLVTVTDGARRSNSSAAGSDGPEVWFFGGSTMYGSGQADDATIPSALVDALAANGVAINATNFGHPAYSQWQQVQLLEAELSAGTRAPPDVVVFYDGFNDLTLQTQFGVHDEPTHLFFGLTTPAATVDEKTVAQTVRSWWADHSSVALAIGRVRDAFGDDAPAIQVAEIEAAPIGSIDPIAAADAAVAIHRRGVDHVTALGAGYGFDALFFWQPYLYTKDPLAPAEVELVGLPGYDTDVWFPMTERVRSRLADPVIDLSDALDGEARSLFWDFVHTNEAGAALIADAILPHLQASLPS
jgi:lysophospholipase L1-like esterase